MKAILMAVLMLASTSVLADPIRIYMATNGDDVNNTGLSSSSPLATLEQVQYRINQYIQQNGAANVEVRIAPGTYHGQSVVWTTTMPNNWIKFMPINNDKNRPVFDGSNAASTFFHVNSKKGENTNLKFRYLWIQHYTTAISFNGDTFNPSGYNGNNTIYGNYFYEIGGKYHPAGPSTAAVRLANSRNNLVRNNHFIKIENKSTEYPGRIHGLYIAHYSSGNDIVNNKFRISSGDSIRFRNYSNNNTVKNVRLIDSGTHGGYSEWYCNEDVSSCARQECPSWNNAFLDNTLDHDYFGNVMNLIYIRWPGDGPAFCGKPSSNSVKVTASGNYIVGEDTDPDPVDPCPGPGDCQIE